MRHTDVAALAQKPDPRASPHPPDVIFLLPQAKMLSFLFNRSSLGVLRHHGSTLGKNPYGTLGFNLQM